MPTWLIAAGGLALILSVVVLAGRLVDRSEDRRAPTAAVAREAGIPGAATGPAAPAAPEAPAPLPIAHGSPAAGQFTEEEIQRQLPPGSSVIR